MKPNLIFLGKPGAGKGTQLQFMYDRGYKAVSVGEVLRKMAKKETNDGKELRRLMNEGKLLPDEFVIKLLDKEIKRKNGLIFDGFPRTLQQAKELDKMLQKRNMKLDGVINIFTPDSLIIKRIAGRYNCRKCGATYNDYGNKPKKEGICDICKGNEFYRRDDDKKSVIKNRLKIYKKEVNPIVDYYKSKDIYYKVSASSGNAIETDKNVMEVISDLS